MKNSRCVLAAICSLVLVVVARAGVPRPYTAVEAGDHQFACLGRTTTLGDFLLPSQIVAADKPILASPIHIFCEPSLAFSNGKSELLSNSGESAKWRWSGESADFRASSTMTADCDGFCWYEIRLEPKHAMKLTSLGLEIGRIAATARYLHTANYTWSNVSGGLPELGGKWSGAFMPYVWLGDEARGLAWCAESDEGWQLSNPAQALRVVTHESAVSFRAMFLDREQTIDSPMVFRFGLQASPVKPVSFAWRAKARILHDIHYESADPGADGRCELDRLRDGGVKTVVIHDSWTKYFGEMVPADAARFRKLIDACHQRGLKLLVYVGYGIARNAPEMKEDHHHDLWSVLPLIPWNPGYKPETRGFDATCPRSGWADWLVAGTDKLFSDYKLDGLYFDGTSEAWTCHNEAHGCGWKDAQGNVHQTYALLAARELMRRIADTVHQHDPDAILDVHMSSNMTLPTLSFADSAWNGEQFEVYTAGKLSVPLSSFRTEFMGYAHGIDTEFLCYEKRPFTFTEAIALAWLHGVEVRPYPQNLSYITPIWRAMDRFGVADAKWLPYWSDVPATCDDADTKISGWSREGKALLIVSHLQRKAAMARVKINLDRLGLREPLQVRDAIKDTPIVITDHRFDLSFEGMDYRLIEIGQ